jgi:hypothetical protein
MTKMKTIFLTLFFFISIIGFSQGTFKGKVLDQSNGETLIGSTVRSIDKSFGTTADINGKFSLKLENGSYEFVVTYVGYKEKTLKVNINNNDVNLSIFLEPTSISLGSIEIISDRAKERQTPVAISNIDGKKVEQLLGSQDIPLVMNITPNVYSTMQGGGSGDARINVRGFDQKNVAIMINGIPINDMENGWVYWSNWDGIGDATSSIQMQRGLSAVNLATPSIGGTMNIITNPAEQYKGVTFKQEYGSGNFLKSSIFGHTGLIDGKYAFSAGVVRKTGNGVIDGTWTDAWAYYLGSSWNINSKNRIEFYAMGAPQKHGQNSYKQNIAAYSHEYASELGFNQEALDKFPESQRGRLYNENWNTVNPNYDGQQYWNGNINDRYSSNYINERENYFHKPLTNLNWYSQLSEKTTLFTSLYYSGGKGGGSGTAGSIKWDYNSPSRIADWNSTIVNNTRTDTAFGILRNSVNNQWSVGILSKLKWDISKNFKTSFGIDARTAEIEHYREVRDLLGGKFFVDNSNQFAVDNRRYLGDKILYDFTNTVDWVGGYAQAEYTKGIMSAYATVGYSSIKYSYVNNFVKDNNGDKLKANTDWLSGYQIKGGLNFNLTDNFNVYANTGYVSKSPIFDAVINDIDGTIASEPKNELFTSSELGAMWRNNNLYINANFYHTIWKDRTRNIGVQLEDGTEGFIFIQGMNQKSLGFEIEANYEINKWSEILIAGSINNWEYTDNVSGTYKDYANPDDIKTYDYYVKGLKTGDAPQTQLVYGLTIKPVKNVRVQALGKFYGDYYSAWDPFTRTDPTDNSQVWKTPSYNIFDLHASYDIITTGNVDLQLFAHVFNLFDKIYIQDAVDNSSYNGYYGPNDEYSHTAMSAEVFLGLPRTYNFGLRINIK